MPADQPSSAASQRSSRQRALLAGGAALIVTGGAGLGAALAAPAGAGVFTAWAGGVAALITSTAVAVASYYADSMRRSRDRIARAQAAAGRLEQELTRVANETLPVIVTRLRDGESAERALAGVPHPVGGPLQRVVHTAAREIAAAETRGATARALRAAMEDDAAQLADVTVPAMVGQLRAGEPQDAVLAAGPAPASAALQRLLAVVARELGSGERRGAEVRRRAREQHVHDREHDAGHRGRQPHARDTGQRVQGNPAHANHPPAREQRDAEHEGHGARRDGRHRRAGDA